MTHLELNKKHTTVEEWQMSAKHKSEPNSSQSINEDKSSNAEILIYSPKHIVAAP